VISLCAPERVLKELGVTEPQEIDLEAIAWHLGARVKFCCLEGCEARIIGYRDRAIIRVDYSKRPRRKRFSIAHELGHWHHHRNRMLVCRPEDIGSHKEGAPQSERVADAYAADLLLPHYLLGPIARDYKRLTARAVREMAELFDTSLTATAIRLVESRHSPLILVCHGREGRKWFARSPDVPARWFPRADLDHESLAFELLFGSGQEQKHPCLIGADAWFERFEAERYELHEHSIRISNVEILTLMLISDDAMLHD
jgi:IrrE N-terminal-like domain